MKDLKTYCILLLLFFNWSSFGVFGQELKNTKNNLKFKHFFTKDGLSQSSVIEIFQDRKGYLWFGTRDGLNKYDGSKFTIYRHNSEDITSLTNSWITSIYEDYYGSLWVGTKDGLNKYNAKLDNFKQYKYSENKLGISNNEIWDLTQIDSTSLWISTNNGINKLDIKNNTFSHFKNEKENTYSLSDNRTRGFLKTKDGKLWITTIENIDLFNPKKNSFKHYDYPTGNIKESHLNNAPTLFKDNKNRVWLGYQQGLGFFNEKEHVFTNYTFKKKHTITSATRSICQDYLGNLWIGTYTGLYILNPEKQKLNHFIHNENDPKSLSQNSIYKIIQDTKGDLWIGTWAGGINYFDRSFDNFKQLSAGLTNKMLNYRVISAIVEDSNQNLWIGTEGGGINIYDKKTGLFTYLTHDPNNPNSLSSNNVKSLTQDHSGNFWIGTHDNGINFLNPKKKPYKFYHFDDDTLNKIDIKQHRILSILEDVNNNIWIGTLTDGIIIYNTTTNSFSKLDTSKNSANCILQSNDPNILIIGGNNGLKKVDIRTKKSIEINYYNQQHKTNVSQSVNCVYEDENLNYWIGTEGQGLYFYNSSNQKTTKYGVSQGLPNEVIYSILKDDLNNLWISTNHGLSKLNLETKKIKNFDESDGLQSNEFNYGASLKTNSGEIIFGGVNGLNYFNPNDIIENNFIPPVDIYSLKVNNKPYLIITDSISKITLKYNQNDFSFDFTALSFSKSNKNKYAYKLVGFDLDWNYIGNKKTATYTNLDEGDYLFKVKASNDNDLWNEKGASFEISILPAPWRTWWAYLIYLLLIIILVYYIRSLAITRIKDKNELKHQKLDKERIEQVNQMKLKLFTNISHDFRTPLTLIIGPLQRMIQAKTGNEFIQKQHETMHRNANMLLQLINQLLDFRKSESGKLVLYASQSNLVSFCNNVKMAFDDLAHHKHIEYIFTSTDDEIEVWFDKIKMKKILFNLLSNAFKFNKENSEVAIKIATGSDSGTKNIGKHIVIKIINYGEVIPMNDLENIFSRFYRLDQQGIQSGTGIGLALTKSLIELHHGSISATSSEEDGTCFTVLLPLGKKHLTKQECITEQDHLKINENIEEVKLFNQIKDLKPLETETETEVLNKSISTLLIVEDNVEVRNFIKDIFRNKYNIYEAENGKNAISLAHKNQIDLIISDVMMPEMDGFEFCKHIKTNLTTSHIPIILLTAKTAKTHQEKGYQIGADVYITKPFDANILEIRVNNLLNSRRRLIDKFKRDIIIEPKELTVTSADELFLQKAIGIVESNLSNPDFLISTFISEMGMSRSVLYRKLKALTDQSLTEFIRTIKLKRAGQLIIKSQMNISEIAFDLGFNDLKHFRKSFKKLFNELPSQYRVNNSPNSKKE